MLFDFRKQPEERRQDNKKMNNKRRNSIVVFFQQFKMYPFEMYKIIIPRLQMFDNV